MSLTQLDERTTVRAGNGLCMEISIQWIRIFCTASIAHWKYVHSGIRTVIGNVLNDREAGSTVGTVDERIEITSVFGVEQFPLTIGTDREIGRKRLVHLVHSL